MSLRSHDLKFARSCDYLAGIDEAGRGALAGPVVASVVIVHHQFFRSSWCTSHARAINDSKLLTPEQREENHHRITQLASEGGCFIGIGQGSVEEIARHNILGATRIAMQRALEAAALAASLPLPPHPSAGPDLFAPQRENATAPTLLETRRPFRILVDGLPLKPFPYAHEALVGGDSKSLVIAMASNLAKVTRDRLLVALHDTQPAYAFALHKGYATPQHLEALTRHGPCAHHRPVFLRKFNERLQTALAFASELDASSVEAD